MAQLQRCIGLRLPSRPAITVARTSSSRSRSTIIRAAMPIDRPSGGGARFPISAAETPPTPATTSGNGTAAPATPPTLQTVTVTGEVSVSSCLGPAAIYNKAAEVGAYKASLPWWKTVLLGILAGCYVALGGALLLTVAPNCPGLASSNPGLQRYLLGAIGFPYALLIILTCGAELFTGNTALVTAAVLEKKATLKQLAKSWICSYTGNAIGCAIGVWLFLNTGLTPQFENGAKAFAVAKVAYPLKETMLKAVAANWFVCLAVWQSLAANSFGSKFIACLGPVSAFVCIGLEHCIANMFFIPAGILMGASVNWGQFIFSNLIPVTIANIFAGAVLVASVYSLIYGRLGRLVEGKE